MTANTNAAPRCKWFAQMIGDHTKRQRLYVNGGETPYFIDTAVVIAHRTYGEKHGLFGAGMHPKGFAATLAFGDKIEPLKHRAEQMALSA